MLGGGGSDYFLVQVELVRTEEKGVETREFATLKCWPAIMSLAEGFP